MSKTYIISETDGYRSMIKVIDPDPITGMIGVQFLTQYLWAKKPDDVQCKHQLFVTADQFKGLATFLKEV